LYKFLLKLFRLDFLVFDSYAVNLV